MTIAGVVGFIFRKLDYPLGPLILALILGPMAESNFRRSSLLASDSSYAIFFTRPISAVLLSIGILALLYPIIKKFLFKNKSITPDLSSKE